MSRRWTVVVVALVLPLGWGLDVGQADPPRTALRAKASGPSTTPSETITMTFTGDVSMTWRGLPANLKRLDWKKNPLRFFSPQFKAADLALSNFEGVLAPGDPKYAEPRLNLWAPVASGQVFKDAHIDLVSNANNHAFDGRDTGVLRTQAALLRTGVKVFGIGRTEAEARGPYIFRKAGTCVAILPGTTKSNKGNRGRARVALYPWNRWSELVKVVRHTVQNVCPNVVVYLHWGTEKIHFPKRKIKAFGRKIIDAGAMLLVGHHPHVLQGVEYYGGGAIVYSLGNFVFSNPKKSHRRTGLLRVELQPLAGNTGKNNNAGNTGKNNNAGKNGRRVRLARLELLPAMIHRGDYTPRPSNRVQAENLLRRLRAYCKPFGTQVVMHQGRIRFLSTADMRVPQATKPAP